MKTQVLFLFLLSSLPNFLNAQVSSLSPSAQTYFENYQQLKIREGEEDPTIEGSPYFNDKFIEGNLFHGSEDSLTAVIRYNIYQDIVEVKKDKLLYGLQKDTSKVNSFVIDDIQFELIPIEYNKEAFTYAQILSKGKYGLYAKYLIEFQRPKEVKAFQEASPAKYVRKPTLYYLKKPDNSFLKIKSFNDIINIFPSRSEELSTFVKKNKLKFKKDEDKISFLDHLNSEI